MIKSNNGLLFESMIERSLEQYELRGQALIKKVATPWNIERNKFTGAIRKAYPVQKSTVDYIGLSQGIGIAFEAKSTISKTSFALKNIKEHQISFLRQWRDEGGISFLLVYFNTHRKTFYLGLDQLIHFIATEERKSIPFDFFEKHCEEVKKNRTIFVDFLDMAFRKERSNV